MANLSAASLPLALEIIGVSIGPGMTRFTRMRSAASSAEAVRVMPATAALVPE
nr:hypothetical protein [Sphingomonas profundi]